MNSVEKEIIHALQGCRFLPGSLEKKLSRETGDNLSPLQKWHLHRFCIKYRKQINNAELLRLSQLFMAENPEAPLRRRDAERMMKKALKEKSPEPPVIDQLKLL